MSPRDPNCTHPRAILLERHYGMEELVCPDCGVTYRIRAEEPVDMRFLGQLRTSLGDKP